MNNHPPFHALRPSHLLAGAAAMTLASAAFAAGMTNENQLRNNQNPQQQTQQQANQNQPLMGPQRNAAQTGQTKAAEALFVRAKNLVGKDVQDASGQKLGTIKDLAVDTNRGQIAFAVLQLGDWIGQGPNNLYAVPFEALEPSGGNQNYVTLKISKAQLKQASGFAEDHYPNMNSQAWAQQIDQQYGYQPYWESHYRAQRQPMSYRSQQTLEPATEWLEQQGLSVAQAQELQAAGYPQNHVQSDLEQAYEKQGLSKQDAQQKAMRQSAQFQRRQMMTQHQQQQNQTAPGSQGQQESRQAQGQHQGHGQAGNQQQAQNQSQGQTGGQQANQGNQEPAAAQSNGVQQLFSPDATQAMTQWLEQQGVSQPEATRIAAGGFTRPKVEHALIHTYKNNGVPDQEARHRAAQMTRQFEQQKQKLTGVSSTGQAMRGRHHGQWNHRNRAARAQPAAHYQPRIERSTEMLGIPVQNPQGEKLGVLNDLVVDTREGRIAYAVVQHGGILGIGVQLAAVPFSAVHFEPQQRLAVVDTTKQTIENVSFGSDHWPDLTSEQWAARIHREFNQRPYWQVYGYGFYISPQATTLSGKITDIQNAAPQQQNSQNQSQQNQQPQDVQVTLQNDQGKTFTVELAPQSVLQQHNLTLAKNQQLQVRAFETQRNGQTIYKAESVTSQNNTIHLRNRHGQPTWQHAGQAQGESEQQIQHQQELQRKRKEQLRQQQQLQNKGTTQNLEGQATNEPGQMHGKGGG